MTRSLVADTKASYRATFGLVLSALHKGEVSMDKSITEILEDNKVRYNVWEKNGMRRVYIAGNKDGYIDLVRGFGVTAQAGTTRRFREFLSACGVEVRVFDAKMAKNTDEYLAKFD